MCNSLRKWTVKCCIPQNKSIHQFLRWLQKNHSKSILIWRLKLFIHNSGCKLVGLLSLIYCETLSLKTETVHVPALIVLYSMLTVPIVSLYEKAYQLNYAELESYFLFTYVSCTHCENWRGKFNLLLFFLQGWGCTALLHAQANQFWYK